MDDWIRKANVRPKSLRQLAVEGKWLADRLDRERYYVLLHLVPPPARLLILRVFARSYRRAAAARWAAEVPVGPLAT